MARSLNKVILIGNLTRDPELRYTPQGTAVCSLGLATNRQWTTDSGEKKEDVEFHRLVAWNKLAEICGQLLRKGRKVYIEGRLQTRTWQGQDGTNRSTTEVVVSDMIMLDSRREGGETAEIVDIPESVMDEPQQEVVASSDLTAKEEGGKKKKKVKSTSEPEASDDEDIPFQLTYAKEKKKNNC